MTSVTIDRVLYGGRDLRCAEAGRDEPRERDTHLDGGEEPIRVAHERGEGPAAAPTLGKPLDLTLAQRHERDLSRGKEATEKDEEEDQRDVDP